MPNDVFGQLIIYLVVLLFAISAHEAAHAWMSHRFGDDTAYLLGRVTLNPVKHTDPIGTLLIPIIGFVFGAIGGPVARIPLIGWSKLLYSFLPASMEPVLATLERYGFIILMAFIYFGFFGVIFAPVGRLLDFLVSL